MKLRFQVVVSESEAGAFQRNESLMTEVKNNIVGALELIRAHSSIPSGGLVGQLVMDVEPNGAVLFTT